MGKQRLKKVA